MISPEGRTAMHVRELLGLQECKGALPGPIAGEYSERTSGLCYFFQSRAGRTQLDEPGKHQEI